MSGVPLQDSVWHWVTRIKGNCLSLLPKHHLNLSLVFTTHKFQNTVDMVLSDKTVLYMLRVKERRFSRKSSICPFSQFPPASLPIKHKHWACFLPHTTSRPPGDYIFLWPQRLTFILHSDLIPKSRLQRSQSTKQLIQASPDSSGRSLVFPSGFRKTKAWEGQRLGAAKARVCPFCKTWQRLNQPQWGGESALEELGSNSWQNIKAFQGWWWRTDLGLCLSPLPFSECLVGDLLESPLTFCSMFQEAAPPEL